MSSASSPNSRGMIIWITGARALAIHERQVSEHGGDADVRDGALLESARPRLRLLHSYGEAPPDLAALAGSLAVGIGPNHPLIDGNKRTAHVCYRAFLAMNDIELVASDEAKFLCMLSLAEGSLDEAGFAAWLRPLIRLDAARSVNEPRGRYARAR